MLVVDGEDMMFENFAKISTIMQDLEVVVDYEYIAEKEEHYK
jgi:hypothetical protein